jgi:DNA-binding transcriptional MerR regulator
VSEAHFAAATQTATQPGGSGRLPPQFQPCLSIGQVAEHTGLTVHALRYYERQGLFAAPVHRDPAGRRLYSQWDLEWLDVCTKLRASGMPLTAIRQYAALVRAGSGNEEARLTLLRQHQRRVTAQITALTGCLSLISFKVQLYEACLAEGFTDPLITPTNPADQPRAQQDQ